MACTPVVTIPRGEYSRKKSRTKKTAPPISRRRGFTLQTLVIVITAMTATVVAVIQVAVQISLRCAFVLSLFLDFRLLASRRTEIAIFQILALFLSVMMDTALVLSNLAGVVAQILIVRRMCERKHQQRTECACYQCEY
jgi:predicted membrane protein